MSAPAAPSRYEVLPVGLSGYGVLDRQTRQWVKGAAFSGQDARESAEHELARIRERYAQGRTPRQARTRSSR